MVLHRIWPKGPFTQRLWEPKDPGTAWVRAFGPSKEYGEHPTDESQVGRYVVAYRTHVADP